MKEDQPQAEQKPIAAFVLSLLAGLWMLAAGSMMSSSGWGFGPGTTGGMMGTGGWMWGHGMMGGLASTSPWWPWFGIIAGIVVLIGAVMLYVKPQQRQGWGIVILIAAALNLFIGRGGFLASALGIIGGALALSKS